MSIQGSLNDVLAATEALLIEVTADRDAALRAAKNADLTARFYLDTITLMKRDNRETKHRADILARRCAEQAKLIGDLLTKYEPARMPQPMPPNPIHAAIATMQRQGVR